MDGCRRARHADRTDRRRDPRQRRKKHIHRRLPEFWLFALGGLFVLVTLFLPKGVVGTAQSYLASRRTSHAAARKESESEKAASLADAETVAAE